MENVNASYEKERVVEKRYLKWDEPNIVSNEKKWSIEYTMAIPHEDLCLGDTLTVTASLEYNHPPKKRAIVFQPPRLQTIAMAKCVNTLHKMTDEECIYVKRIYESDLFDLDFLDLKMIKQNDELFHEHCFMRRYPLYPSMETRTYGQTMHRGHYHGLFTNHSMDYVQRYIVSWICPSRSLQYKYGSSESETIVRQPASQVTSQDRVGRFTEVNLVDRE